VNVLRRPGFAAFALATSAVLWAAGLVLAGWLAPMYGDGATLVEENGASVLIPVSVPLLLAALGWAFLRLTCTGHGIAERLAIGVLVALALFAVVTGFSIGVLVVPVLLLLIGAFTLTPRPLAQ